MSLGDWLLGLLANLIALLIVLWIERQRRPRLTIKLGVPNRIEPNDPANRPQAAWLHLIVENRDVLRWLRPIFFGDPALACRAFISFLHLDGQKVYDREMLGRWADTPEPDIQMIPVASAGASGPQMPNAQQVVLRLAGVRDSVDIAPGEATRLDSVFRSASDDDCYGWCNESYLHNWHHPDWKLPKGRYILCVRVKTGGREFRQEFLVVNDVPYQDFRLEELTSTNRKALP